jgi:type I restriction enzyme, S subunit
MQTDCFPNATSEWRKRPLSSLAQVNPRYPVKRGAEYPFVEMASVGERFAGITSFDRRQAGASGLSRFKDGDTLFAKITPCPENGKVAFVDGLVGEVGLGSTEFIVLAPMGTTDPRFLFHLVCSHDVRGRAVARMEGSTGRQRVPEEVFTKRLLVPIPTPQEQASIADFLDAVDRTREQVQVAAIRTSELERSVIADAFASLDADWRRLGDFDIETRYGTSQASNDRGFGNPVLRIPNVIGDRLRLDDLAYTELSQADIDRLSLQDGDLLLVRTNGNPNYVGRSVVFRQPDPRVWVYASYLIRVRLPSVLSPDYVNAFLGTVRGRQELLRRVTTSAGNHNINSNSIRLLSIPMPRDANDQDRIVQLAASCRRNVDALKAKTDALLDLKDSVMHDLFTGRVRTSAATAGVAS